MNESLPTCMTRLLGLEWYECRLMKNEYPLFGAYLRAQVQVRPCQFQSRGLHSFTLELNLSNSRTHS